MADKKKNNNTNIDMPVLTERDMELLIGALRCVEGGFPKPDMHKFTEMVGFKNTNSASVSLGSLKKKVMGEITTAKPTPKKAAAAGKRKQNAITNVVDPSNGDGGDLVEAPAKKPKPAPKKAAAKPVKAEDKSIKAEVDDDINLSFE